jgi:hypothetical protein
MRHTRFELGFPRNRKVSRLSDAAFRLWTSAIDHAREQRTDGRIEPGDLLVIPRGGGAVSWKPSVVKELVDAGLWDTEKGGWKIHNFLVWQDSKAQVDRAREQARGRMANVRANRARGSPEVHANSSPDVRANLERTSREVRVGSSDSDSASSSDSDQVFDPESGTQEISPRAHEGPGTANAVKRIANLEDALRLPVQERAIFTEENRHLAEWLRPEAWPEVRSVAHALHAANRGNGAPKLGSYAADSGVRRVVELYAAGFTEHELEALCATVVLEKWWTEGGKPKSLGALTVEVCRRATAAPGALEHAQREAELDPSERERIRRLADKHRPKPVAAVGSVTPALGRGGS